MADSSIENAGLVIVDKNEGITSHDVVSRCRKLFNTRRVGHAGTLDPMATGVLVVGVERATKLLGLLALTTKSYTATIRLGAATDSDDRMGEVISSADASSITDEQIAATVATLTGDIEQVPAKVSAIKVDGRRAHALARTGEEFELAARPVTVSRFDVLARRDEGEFVDLDVVVDCSAGTYIRSLARDLGAALGVGGHLTALRRTAVGPFTLEHARTLEQLAERPELSLTIDEAALISFPHRDIDDDEAESISQGRWLTPIGRKGIYVVVDPAGQAIALVQEKGRRASSVMVVRPATLR
ncbi:MULTISPECIES: tRNA pseudouridine(55) synthase TruB [Gordonia]|uniref:tRNA pseudouridine synthase B n=1 Tax=Gordonia sputi NBRC 100414 TaxID=1089453 RepID=H5TYJ4_9ACTN|nr:MULTISPECIES: tRNA pseudouridine(55) synthase TruB [Gordonia]NKY95059.1 tRNA pseudouridine(55) synthase TruB [Gordonia sputi]OBA30468.1 tRNA pseudouridine(55) synthase TruB [Gordonia sp. 852002-51296_SCH5728562-b]OBC05218.1 tRNA pseudouridine(55) synthase TruB [Gordonia sp. 852002-50395_SCH5434458]OBC12871.1 tRNA pseudouridine(55) synthase TruB [Gordonia sp. 852002-50816_SCH5313054-a]OBC18868.1 tRNA pseudouridine(55) synthase TruB [Gordonia sp. 852002-50816_SCH5313054-c]